MRGSGLARPQGIAPGAPGQLPSFSRRGSGRRRREAGKAARDGGSGLREATATSLPTSPPACAGGERFPARAACAGVSV